MDFIVIFFLQTFSMGRTELSSRKHCDWFEQQ